MKSKSSIFLAVAVAAVFAGCGGGGGGTTPPPITSTPVPSPSSIASAHPSSAPSASASVTPSSAPSAAASASVSPSPSPSATVVGTAYTGTVTDSDHGGVPVANALVQVGTGYSYVAGTGFTISGVTAHTNTNANGTFSISAPAGSLYVQVSASSTLIPAHRPLPASAGAFAATFALPTANADETAGLATLNANRATLGTGTGAEPLALDADLMICARSHSANMAALGYFGHQAPGQTVTYEGTCLEPLAGFVFNPYYELENIANYPSGTSTSGGSLSFADNAYIADGPGDGHYTTVLNANALWVGLGAAYNGTPSSGCAGSCVSESYFTEDYYSNGNAAL